MKDKLGSIYVWFFDRGFGFIISGEGKAREKFFLHISQLTGEPVLEALVAFNVKAIKEGALRTAIDAEIVSCEGGKV